MDLKVPGLIMIAPTLLLAIYITYKFRTMVSELYHNMAVCSWIMANTVWMIGEFFFEDTLRPYAIVFFLIGLAILAIYYIFLHGQVKESELTDVH